MDPVDRGGGGMASESESESDPEPEASPERCDDGCDADPGSASKR